MKLTILIALIFLAITTQAKFQKKHKELSGVEKALNKLDNRLLRQIATSKRIINLARLRRNRRHANRRSALLKLRAATRKRIKSEVSYNLARRDEEKKNRRFRIAHRLYLNSKAAYRRIHIRQTKRIRAFDKERATVEKIRRLLGKNHRKKWKSYKKQKAVKYQRKSHSRHRKIGSYFSQRHKRFVARAVVRKRCRQRFFHRRSHTCKGTRCCTFKYFIFRGGKRKLFNVRCKWAKLACKPKGRTSVITGTADDVLHVYVNGRYLGKQQKTQKNWTKSTRWVTKLKKGDVIQVFTYNNGRYSRHNPAALKMQVRYGTRTFYTNTRTWRCQKHKNNFRNVGAKDVKRVPRSRLVPYNYHKVNGISNRAKWIWTRNLRTKYVDCFFVIPF